MKAKKTTGKKTTKSTTKKATKKVASKAGQITSVAGPVVKAIGIDKAKINDIVHVGREALLGEIIEIEGDKSIIQVYEETDGIVPGEPVVNTYKPLSVELGPGILSMVYDGVQRPLEDIRERSGTFIDRGIHLPALDASKKWDFVPTVKKGDEVSAGDIIGTVEENSLITHKILVPRGVNGKVSSIKAGKYTIKDEVAKVGTTSLTMVQSWPVREARPVQKKVHAGTPLVTGQRVYDVFFPTVKGGQGAIPGPFGCGKTVTQQAIAKWCDAQIIVYIGCGERGNEMTEVLTEFPELKDPKTGEPLMNRTILIANTSNMPVAAREASIYTGITIAEYFRDQGFDVALMADSTSRWAEAMREISGRLEEMPGEEGYPAYLANRLSNFYERAGRANTLCGETGSITVIGAVSPPGGDFSEPVTQNTLRTTKVFWALDAKLAAKRHYWAINWLQSYSLYLDDTDQWYDKNINKQWSSARKQMMTLLQKEANLAEIAQLIGKDSLPDKEQLVLFVGKMIREDILQQNAFDPNDMYCPLDKQFQMINNISLFYAGALHAISTEQMSMVDIEALELVEKVANMKYVPNKGAAKELEALGKDIQKIFKVKSQ